MKGLAIQALGKQPSHLSPTAATAFADLQRHLTEGRSGQPWCRWIAGCLREGKFFVADASDRGTAESEFDELVTATAESFVDLIDNESFSKGPSIALTVLLPGSLLLNMAENVLATRRLGLVVEGLMVAVLHPDARHRSLTAGPPGKPYGTRWPFLTIRRPVREDEVFVRINPMLHQALGKWLDRESLNEK